MLAFIRLSLIHFLLCFSANVFGFEVPRLTGPVMDEVGLLTPSNKAHLNQMLFQLQKEKGVQLQIYITSSLHDEPIESVAIQIFDQWKLGDEKTDKGLLFIIAPNEKKLRIEVGQGLEGDIPDVIAKRIISDVVKPYFLKGNFNLGILQGVNALQVYIENPDATKEALLQEKNREKTGPLRGGIIVLVIIGIWLIIFFMNPTLALYLLFSILRGGRGGGNDSWPGGGGWSGGGGKSSGGGASGGW